MLSVDVSFHVALSLILSWWVKTDLKRHHGVIVPLTLMIWIAKGCMQVHAGYIY